MEAKNMRRGSGRPAGSAKYPRRFNLLLTPAQWRWVEERAMRFDVSVATVIREALTRAMNSAERET